MTITSLLLSTLDTDHLNFISIMFFSYLPNSLIGLYKLDKKQSDISGKKKIRIFINICLRFTYEKISVMFYTFVLHYLELT